MKIGLIGATGFVGSAILQEGLNRGHEVTAIERDPEKLTAQPKLHPKKGDVYNKDELAGLIAGHDAVISAFNPGWKDPEIYEHQIKGARAIIDAVKQAGVKRLLFVGGAGDRALRRSWPIPLRASPSLLLQPSHCSNDFNCLTA